MGVMNKDEKLIQLYFERNEQAIAKTEAAYGRYCHAIAYRILEDEEDTLECLNDTWLKLWNAIPPEVPDNFAAYAGRITRNLAINLGKKRSTLKRGGDRYAACIDELAEVIPDAAADAFEQIALNELTDAINAFLDTVDEKKRNVFVRRYFYMDSLDEIAARYRMTLSNVKVTLHRLRAGLKEKLESEGYTL